MITCADKVAVSSGACDSLDSLGMEIMFRLCEVNAMVRGCLALVDNAEEDLVPDNRVPQEITDLFCLLRVTSDRLTEHYEYVDTEFARLRKQ